MEVEGEGEFLQNFPLQLNEVEMEAKMYVSQTLYCSYMVVVVEEEEEGEEIDSPSVPA